MKQLCLAAALALSLTACSDDEEGAASADVEACEHLQDGPSTAVTATAAATGAPAVGNDHRRYDVTLADVTGGKGGAVSFAVSEATDYVLFLDTAVPVAVTQGSAAVLAEETATSSPECGEVKARQVFALGVGTYTLTFGPTAATRVGLVLEEAAHSDAE